MDNVRLVHLMTAGTATNTMTATAPFATSTATPYATCTATTMNDDNYSNNYSNYRKYFWYSNGTIHHATR